MTEMSVRQWQERFRAGDFSSKDRAVQCEAGWYDWFCQDDALAGRLQKLSKVVMGITDPYILDHYYVWFKNNCPLSGPLYDDIRFEPLHGDRSGKYFVVIRDSPHEAHKWTLYTGRHGFEQPEFTCGNVRDTVDLGYAGSNTRRGRVGHDIAHNLETSCIQGIVERGGRIRRLMPRESLRLQGFAEEQIDKILAFTSDAQAYKQAGNSVTVTVIEAIGRRILAVDEELRKMGDAA